MPSAPARHAAAPSRPPPARPTAGVLRRCACGGRAGPSGECEECRAKRLGLQRSAAAPAAPGFAPPLVHDVLRSPGEPLDAGARAYLEPRFGHSFAEVRVHADGRAAESAAAVSAHAYTVGRDVVFGAGKYAPASAEGRRLIAHELAHVVQQSAAGRAAPMPSLEVGALDAPEERAAEAAADAALAGRGQARAPGGAGEPLLRRVPAYPTVDQQRGIQDELNPQQAQAAATGTSVPAVTHPAQFRQQMAQRMTTYISAALGPAQARQASSVSLGIPAIQSLADVAQQEVTRHYGPLLGAAPHIPAETQRRAGQRLRDEVRDVASMAPQVDDVLCQWVADRMENEGGSLLSRFNVLASSGTSKGSCPTPACPAAAHPAAAAAPTGERDQALYDLARDEIVCAHRADLRTIILFQSSFERPGEVFMQTHLAPRAGDTAQDRERRGRWDTLSVLVHEMLHDVAHENFRDGVSGLERAGVATEGFAEYFARPVSEAIRQRASTPAGAALRASIEGVQAPFSPSVAVIRYGYQRRVDVVVRIRDDVLGGNEDNLKLAFFLGQMEYLGLGGWTAWEARRRAALRQPGTLGVVGLVFPGGTTFGTVPGGPGALPATSGGARLEYGHAVVGVGGPFQLQVGGQLQVLSSSGSAAASVTIGPSLSARYQWPYLYLQAGVGVGVGGAMSDLGQGWRLDVIPEFRAGVQLGIVRVSGGPVAVIPVAGGPLSDHTIRLGGVLGISVDLGGP